MKALSRSSHRWSNQSVKILFNIYILKTKSIIILTTNSLTLLWNSKKRKTVKAVRRQ